MDEELRKKVEQYIREQEKAMRSTGTMVGGVHQPTINTAITQTKHNGAKQATVYSLAEVQLVSGDMVGMTITASPTISKYLMEAMQGTGFLHLYNDEETLMLRAADVRAIKLTKITLE